MVVEEVIPRDLKSGSMGENVLITKEAGFIGSHLCTMYNVRNMTASPLHIFIQSINYNENIDN